MSILLLRSGPSGPGIVAAGLQAFYAFDEGVGQTLEDGSGGGNDGTLGSTAGADTNDPTWTGEGLRFTIDDFVDCGAAPALRPDGWTICAAVKLTPGATVPLVGWHSSVQVPAVYAAAPFNAFRPLIWLGNNCFRYFEAGSPVNLQDEAWHFVLFSCPGNTTTDILSASLTVDGQDQVVTSTTNTADGAAKDTFRIGSAAAAQFADADVAFLAFHDRVLSTAEKDQMRTFAKNTLIGRVALP